jgi:uncharacterized Fe-S cluster-containing protein
MENKNQEKTAVQLPGLDCGLCGQKSCEQFSQVILNDPQEIYRCIHLTQGKVQGDKPQTAAEKKDYLGREYDFILDTFPNEPGPREVILPHNPARVKELDIKTGDIMIGRPMGMSCGCPVTHCGIVMDVDYDNGVVIWCVTGPLGPRTHEHKDIGYYSAQAYEGIVKDSHKELKIGMRYWFMPRRCMLQWRHSGLINFINKRNEGIQVRIEGLMIG